MPEDKQHLPNYKHDFLNDSRWVVKNSPHYRFHYFAGSLTERKIDQIISTQESAYTKIISFLRVAKPKQPIEYYLYPDEKTKADLMGDDWYAQAIADEFRVHILYTDKIKAIGPHEDTHLLSLPWGDSFGFFAEGLAEYLVGQTWDGRSHLEYVREGYNKNIYPSLADFMTHQAWLDTDDTQAIYFYGLAGAFTAFLINSCGKDKFESFYRRSRRNNSKEQNSQLFQSVYGKSIEDAELEFKKVALS